MMLAFIPFGLHATLAEGGEGPEASETPLPASSILYLPEMITDIGGPTDPFMRVDMELVPWEGLVDEDDEDSTDIRTEDLKELLADPGKYAFPKAKDITAMVVFRLKRNDNDVLDPPYVRTQYETQLAEGFDVTKLEILVWHGGPNSDEPFGWGKMNLPPGYEINSQNYVAFPGQTTNQPVGKSAKTTYAGIFPIIAYYGEIPNLNPTEEPTEEPTPEITPTPSATVPTATPTPNPFPLGDLNCSGKVDIDDILLARDIIFGKTPTAPQLEQLKRLNPPNGTANIDQILRIRDIIFGSP